MSWVKYRNILSLMNMSNWHNVQKKSSVIVVSVIIITLLSFSLPNKENLYFPKWIFSNTLGSWLFILAIRNNCALFLLKLSLTIFHYYHPHSSQENRLESSRLGIIVINHRYFCKRYVRTFFQIQKREKKTNMGNGDAFI